MNDIFLDLTDLAGDSVLVNASHIIKAHYHASNFTTEITLTGGAKVFVEQSTNDIYTVIRSFQNERRNEHEQNN